MHTSFDVQTFPSEQLVPLFAFDQLVVEVMGLQTWHALAGFSALEPTLTPPITQPVPQLPPLHTWLAPQLVPLGRLG